MAKEIKNELMSQIRKNELKIKSKWVFIAKKMGIKSGLALVILLLVFLINAFFYYIKTNNLLISLHYGPAFWQRLLHSLPYDLILIIIVLGVLLNFIVKRFDFSYKKPFAFISAVFIIFIILGAFTVFATDFNTLLRQGLARCPFKIPYISDFYLRRCGCNSPPDINNPPLNSIKTE